MKKATDMIEKFMNPATDTLLPPIAGKKVDAKTLKPKAAKAKGSKSTPEDRDWVKVAGDSSLSNEWFLIDGDAVKARMPKEESSVMHNTKDSAQKGAAEDTASKPFGLTKL
tara:strand:- start:80 stop:412 length:333 start_codon:yes stop_codon:yes gene_type:complete